MTDSKWTPDTVREAFQAEIERWGGYAPPTTSMDRSLVNAIVRYLGPTYKDAWAKAGAKKRPRGMSVPPPPPKPEPERPDEFDYDLCLVEMERALYKRRQNKGLEQEAKNTPERHIPPRNFRQFHVPSRAERKSPSFLPARDAIDTWRLTRRDAA